MKNDNKNIKMEAIGNFSFNFFIEEAIAKSENIEGEEEMIIEGVASTTNIDHDSERMAPEALFSMVEIINTKAVPLRVEHNKSENAVVGSVYKAWVDDRNQMWIKAKLDKSHPASGILFKSLKDGVKLGLSVGGHVVSAVSEMAESVGKMVKTFYKVLVNEVSVTQHPANYDSYLIRKSIIKNSNEIDDVEPGFIKSFLFETRSNDYLYSIAKSIPDNAWKKINNNGYNNNVMKKTSEETTETKVKAVEETETKETETSKSEETFKAMVVKSIENLTNLVTKLAKTSDETTSETKEKAESEDKTNETTIMEDTKTSKAEETTTETETKEKAESTETTEEKAETKESETTEEKTESYGAEYKLKSLLGRLDKMSKSMEGEVTTETESKEKAETEETETNKSIDDFVDALEKSVHALESKMEKNNTRVPGLVEQIVKSIREDSEIQKSIKDMLQEPGAKKSVSMGTPFMKSKDGKFFSLTPFTQEVKKSTKEVGTFKDFYKENLSSIS